MICRIDHRFYRWRYEAQKTLQEISAKIRGHTDLDVLGEDIVAVVRETVQPAHVSLWLAPDRGKGTDE